MTATMIDRLAAALKVALNGYDAGDDLILVNERHSDGSLRELAYTVLLEMRSPTDEMRRAGAVHFELVSVEAAEAAGTVYEVMIEAALTT